MNDSYRPFADLLRERLQISRWTRADPARRGPVPVAGRDVARRHWQDAVTTQAALAGQGEAAAERAVISMLNQMTSLARAASWWESHAEAAIAETVGYASGNLAVASAEAQRAWETYWSAHLTLVSMFGEFGPDSGAPDEAELHALNDCMGRALTQWRAAWDDWHRAQSGSQGAAESPPAKPLGKP